MRFIRIAATAAIALVSATNAAFAQRAVQETGCDVATEDSNGNVGYSGAPDLHVLDHTAINPKFGLNVPDGTKVLALKCYRTDVVPAENDYKVIEAGYVLYISVIEEDDSERISVLERSDGRFRIRMAAGEMTKNEKKRAASLAKWLNGE